MTGVQTCALPISSSLPNPPPYPRAYSPSGTSSSSLSLAVRAPRWLQVGSSLWARLTHFCEDRRGDPAYRSILSWSSNIWSGTRSQSRRQRRRFVAEPKTRIVPQAGTCVVASPRLGTRFGSDVSAFLANSTFRAAAKPCVVPREGLVSGGDGRNEFSLFVDYTKRFCGTPANLFRVALLVVSGSLPSLPLRF